MELVSFLGRICSLDRFRYTPEEAACSKRARAKLESIDVEAVLACTQKLYPGVTSEDVNQVVNFARTQGYLTHTTRFGGGKHQLPFTVTITPEGTLFLSVGKTRKMEDGILGLGGTKTVYVALKIDGKLVETVAELVSRCGPLSHDPAENEYQLMSSLQSPYVMEAGEGLVRYLGSRGTGEKVVWFQPRMTGDGIALDGNTLNLKEKLAVLRSVLLGVDYLHTSRIVHSDLRVPNILIEKKDDQIGAKITDFGSAVRWQPALDDKDFVIDCVFERQNIAVAIMNMIIEHEKAPQALVRLKERMQNPSLDQVPSAGLCALEVAQIMSEHFA